MGYLPRGRAALERLWEEAASWDGAIVAFESPKRLPATLRSLAGADPGRPVAVCRELTKRFEEVVRGPAEEIAARFAEPPKGEITVVLGPSGDTGSGAEQDALAAVVELVETGLPRRRAADLISGLTGVPRNKLYKASL